jgi:hypothetical protein
MIQSASWTCWDTYQVREVLYQVNTREILIGVGTNTDHEARWQSAFLPSPAILTAVAKRGGRVGCW